jgi:surface antigen
MPLARIRPVGGLAATAFLVGAVVGAGCGPRGHPDAGLQRGQCTWYAHQRTQDVGWRLRFSAPHGRHARAWWDMVVNAERGDEPRAHSVMVLDSWPGNPYGHVAFVEQVQGPEHWTITHANFALGRPSSPRAGVPIYRTEVARVAGGVRLANGEAVYPLRGFLYAPR